MAEYREIHTYENEPSSNSTALVIFIVAALALVLVGLFMWQPWAVPGPSSTTVITQPAAPAEKPAPNNTTIINPPAVNPPAHTDVNIHNDAGATKGDTGDTGTTTGDTGDSGTGSSGG